MALIVALMATLMMLILGGGVAVTSVTEMSIAANHRDGLQTLYAAEAGVDLAAARLRSIADWSTVTAAPNGPPLLAGPLTLLLPSDGVDARIAIAVTVAPDPGGNPEVVIVDSIASDAAGVRRRVQATVTRGLPNAAGVRAVRILSWR